MDARPLAPGWKGPTSGRAVGERLARMLTLTQLTARPTYCMAHGGDVRRVQVEAAFGAACGGAAPPAVVLRPSECEGMLSAPSDQRPFDLKHGLQQASIMGGWATGREGAMAGEEDGVNEPVGWPRERVWVAGDV